MAQERKMNEAPQISTVDEACTFISSWFGWKNDLVGSQITLPFAVPQAIKTVNRRLGRLWLERGNIRILMADHAPPYGATSSTCDSFNGIEAPKSETEKDELHDQ
jgi:hypothetical protein